MLQYIWQIWLNPFRYNKNYDKGNIYESKSIFYNKQLKNNTLS